VDSAETAVIEAAAAADLLLSAQQNVLPRNPS